MSEEVVIQRDDTFAAVLRSAEDGDLINVLGTELRDAFHHAFPADVYPLARRPSFTGKGTDSSAYAWFVWGPSRGGRWFPALPDARRA